MKAIAAASLALMFWASLGAEGRTLNGFELDGALIPADEIHAGGPPRDGIPALDEPRFVAAEDADFLKPESRILGVAVDGKAKAYPVAILNWHEVVNDRLAGTDLVVTYCPLCGTGVVYESRQQGQALSFGVSGLLYNSDVLLYDRQTQSLWSQLRHQAVAGPLKGEKLKPLAASMALWSEWRQRHPDTLVLSRDTGYRRDYDRNPYGGYEESMALYFPVSFLSRQYHPKERVMGVELDGQFKAYPFAELGKLGEKGNLSDSFAGRTLEISYNAPARTAEVRDAQGKLLPAINSFWFAWYAFHPDTAVYEAP